MNNLIAHLVQAAIYIAKTQLKGGEVRDALLDIIQTGVEAYEEHTGQCLDPALIKVEDPI